MFKKVVLLSLLASSVFAAELQHTFNSPSFSGVGYSNHVLTIHQLEQQASEKQKSIADTIRAKAEADAANTPTAKFLANVESRIYSQLAKQLTDSLFAEGSTCTVGSGICGSIPDLGGNNVSWQMITQSVNGNNQQMIQIDITNNISGQSTNMVVPAGSFYF